MNRWPKAANTVRSLNVTNASRTSCSRAAISRKRLTRLGQRCASRPIPAHASAPSNRSKARPFVRECRDFLAALEPNRILPYVICRMKSSGNSRRHAKTGKGVTVGTQEVRDSIDGITGRILRLIASDQIPPGGRLPSERELAQSLGVSRPALRESLARLEATRLIVCRPASGIFLAEQDSPPSFESIVLRNDLGLPLDSNTIVSSLEVRRILEVQAVDLACQRHSRGDAERLREIVEATRARLRDQQSIIDLDEAFHLAIVTATQNPVLFQIVHSFYRLSKPRREIYFADLARCRRSSREHAVILGAILARDSSVARHMMERHIDDGLIRRAIDRASMRTTAPRAPEGT